MAQRVWMGGGRVLWRRLFSVTLFSWFLSQTETWLSVIEDLYASGFVQNDRSFLSLFSDFHAAFSLSVLGLESSSSQSQALIKFSS